MSYNLLFGLLICFCPIIKASTVEKPQVFSEVSAFVHTDAPLAATPFENQSGIVELLPSVTTKSQPIADQQSRQKSDNGKEKGKNWITNPLNNPIYHIVLLFMAGIGASCLVNWLYGQYDMWRQTRDIIQWFKDETQKNRDYLANV